MDRALKERIIGAVVLVVFVVLVVPVFLDGPEGPADVETRSVPLPGQSDQPTKVVVLPRDRSEPVPPPITLPAPGDDEVDEQLSSAGETDDAAVEPVAAAEEPEPVEPEPSVTQAEQPTERPAPAILADDDEPAPSEPADDDEPPARAANSQPEPSPPVATSAMWAVQLGSFSSEANANRLAAELKRKGFGAFLSRVPGSSGELLRVRVGPQANRPAAEAMAERLRAAGYRGQVVPYR